jgi:hypothetical protein
VRPAGRLEPLAALLGEDGVGDPGVALARALPHPTVALEPVEQASDAGGGEHEALGEIHAFQPVLVGLGEV